MITQSQIYESVPQETVAQNPDITDERELAQVTLTQLQIEVALQNGIREKGRKLKFPQDLSPVSISVLIAARTDVALVSPGDKSQSGKKQSLTSEQRRNLPIGIYQTAGCRATFYE